MVLFFGLVVSVDPSPEKFSADALVHSNWKINKISIPLFQSSNISQANPKSRRLIN